MCVPYVKHFIDFLIVTIFQFNDKMNDSSNEIVTLAKELDKNNKNLMKHSLPHVVFPFSGSYKIYKPKFTHKVKKKSNFKIFCGYSL